MRFIAFRQAIFDKPKFIQLHTYDEISVDCLYAHIEQMTEQLKSILEGQPLSALVKPGQKIVLLEHNMTVGDALRVRHQ